jgi:hypothetical protein
VKGLQDKETGGPEKNNGRGFLFSIIVIIGNSGQKIMAARKGNAMQGAADIISEMMLSLIMGEQRSRIQYLVNIESQ